LQQALRIAEPSDRVGALAALAHHRLSYLETTQLARALPVDVSDVPGFTTVRLAILGSHTVEHLVPAIKVAGLRRNVWITTYVAPYGQYRQELLDQSAALQSFQPQFVLFATSADALVRSIAIDAKPDDVSRSLAWTVGEFRQLWRIARESLGAVVLQQTFLNAELPVFGSYDLVVSASPSRVVHDLNNLVAAAAAADHVSLVDVTRVSENDGTTAWFDATRWFEAKMQVSPNAAASYGELVARVIAAHRGLSRKCLVLDLDNTMWGGVIGDDGLEGIVLGEGNAAGEAHLALQRYARRLRERGVILAVCSKNDPAIAEAAVRDHPEMLLRPSDFAAFVANWNDKAENLRMIAAKLNIGLDSLVFVDDNPAERARIRESLPMVAVPELPASVADYVPTLASAGYFEAIAFTEEDRDRGAQYAANAQRESLLESSQSMDDFLRGLEMAVAYASFRAVDLARVTQLINKTNQFNVTTRRYSSGDVAQFQSGADCLTLQFRLVDRFGDNGIVSVMILTPQADSPGVLDIDTWVMSCRVFGRQLEHEAMNIAVEAARARGISAIRARYVPTPKNAVVRDLYPKLGFVQCAASESGETHWLLRLEDYVSHRTFITRRADTE